MKQLNTQLMLDHEALSLLYRTRLLQALGLIVMVTGTGTMGYHILEGWSFFDSLYMTVITLTTVGYGETHPLTPRGRVFTMFLLISSIGIAGYAVSTLASFVVEGELTQILQGRRMMRQIADLKDHIVLCGGGHTGQHIAAEFFKTKTPFVLIEQNPEVIEHLLPIGEFPYIQADATLDETLAFAGIERAKGLVASLGEDKDNVFIVLSARSLNPKLRIIARLIDEKNSEKLRKAGADEVVSANAIGGMRMASVMIRPSVVTFLDEMLRGSNETLRFEEVSVSETPGLLNKTLGSADIGRRFGLLVVAIRSKDGDYTFNPGAQTVLQESDRLIVIGAQEKITSLREG